MTWHAQHRRQHRDWLAHPVCHRVLAMLPPLLLSIAAAFVVLLLLGLIGTR